MRGESIHGARRLTGKNVSRPQRRAPRTPGCRTALRVLRRGYCTARANAVHLAACMTGRFRG